MLHLAAAAAAAVMREVQPQLLVQAALALEVLVEPLETAVVKADLE